jgi:hypothetical protein
MDGVEVEVSVTTRSQGATIMRIATICLYLRSSIFPARFFLVFDPNRLLQISADSDPDSSPCDSQTVIAVMRWSSAVLPRSPSWALPLATKLLRPA